MKNNKLKLSIIIPCADDLRIKQCLESIDEPVETIVSLNGPTNKIKQMVKKYKAKVIEIPERNLPKALNHGIQKSKNELVVFMDSDCIFQKGAIRKLYKGLLKNRVVRGQVVFTRKDFVSNIIANFREYFYSGKNKSYNPFLGINKDIVSSIGNYYFDDEIRWTEDADLGERLKKSQINIKYIKSAKVFHPPFTLRHDLEGAFRYGIAKRIRVEKNVSKGMGTHFMNILDISRKKGVLTGIYYFVWNFVYAIGYLYQITKDPYGVRRHLKH